MNKPMIENSDRGITMNKPLAWSMGVALVSAAFWVGTTTQDLKSATNDLTEAQQGFAVAAKESRAEIKARDDEQDGRIRVLETAAARSDERMINVLDLFKRIDARLARIEQHGEDRP